MMYGTLLDICAKSAYILLLEMDFIAQSSVVKFSDQPLPIDKCFI